MPVKLPSKQPTDPRLLSLLHRMAANRGTILLTDEEYAEIEHEPYFSDAEQRRLFRVDTGGEWSTGAVLFMTRAGAALVAPPSETRFWRRIEELFRRSMGGDGSTGDL